MYSLSSNGVEVLKSKHLLLGGQGGGGGGNNFCSGSFVLGCGEDLTSK